MSGVRELHASRGAYELRRPFRIARGVKMVADVVAVTLYEDGWAGEGEGVPYLRYGESVESALAAIEAVRDAVEGGVTRRDLAALLPPGAARNALDCALWDLESQLLSRSVASLIGAPEPARMPSALTIGIDAPEVMARFARELAHVPLIKVKIDAEDPTARIRAVRAEAPRAALIVDPNESWDEALTRAMQPVLADASVALLEQPVPADADAWLQGFTPAVPICADESVHVAADLDRVARRYQVVNVKLDKAGGLTAALELAHAARSRGLGLMTGCMVSSSLSIAPALHIARMSDFVDLDGPLWLRWDWPAGIRNEGGVLVPPEPDFWGSGA